MDTVFANPHAEPRLETIDVILAANGAAALPLHGSFFDVVEATGAVRVKIEGQYGARMEKGLGYEAPPGQGFTILIVEDLSGAPNTVRIAYGEGAFHDRRTSITGSVAIGGSLPAGTNSIGKLNIPASIDDAADVALNNGAETSLGAPPAGTREQVVTALAANTVTIRIGKTGQVGAARGIPLAPGQTIILNTSATLRAWATAAAQAVAIGYVVD